MQIAEVLYQPENRQEMFAVLQPDITTVVEVEFRRHSHDKQLGA